MGQLPSVCALSLTRSLFLSLSLSLSLFFCVQVHATLQGSQSAVMRETAGVSLLLGLATVTVSVVHGETVVMTSSTSVPVSINTYICIGI